MKPGRIFFAAALTFLASAAHAATALQWGVDRTTTPWTTCVYDANNVCQGVFTVPATGGGALTPPSRGGTGINNGANTFTIGGNVAFSGSFTFTGNITGNTNITFPTSGTLATTTTPAPSIVVGSTAITGGSSGNIEINNGGVLGEISAVPVPHGGTGQTTFAVNQPLLGNGASSLNQGTLSGNQTKFATVNGSPVSGHCASWDSNGNVVDAGGACTTGGGGGTVSAGTANDLGYYATSSTVISPLATANNGVLVTNGSGAPSISTTLPNMALGTPSSLTLTNASGLPLSGVVAQAANTVAGNATASSAAPTALAMPSCSGAANALIWTTSGGFGCNSLSTGTITGVTAGAGTTGGGASGTVTITSVFGPGEIENCIVAASVSGNALTVTLETQSGATPSSSSPCVIAFRNATLTTGDYTAVQVTASTTFSTGTSGSTFGSSNGVPFRLWVEAWNNAGTAAIGVSDQSNANTILPLNEGITQASLACNACTNATTLGTFYTTTALSGKAIRILGYLEWGSGLTTAGTYASGPTFIQLMSPGGKKPGDIVQTIYQQSGTLSTTTNTYTLSATPPTTGGGFQLASASMTPTASPNLLRIRGQGVLVNAGTGNQYTAFIYNGSSVLAVSPGAQGPTAQFPVTLPVSYQGLAGGTSSITFSIYGTGTANTTGVNGSTTTQFFGGVSDTFIQVDEIMGALEPVNDNQLRKAA